MFLFLITLRQIKIIDIDYDNETNTLITWNITGAEDYYIAKAFNDAIEKDFGRELFINIISNVVSMIIVVIGAVIALFLKGCISKLFN
jgi:hypothetical protein